ncbi:MAG: phage tail tip lysozyme [Muribaculaceae bacterium]|nr:phage tail tip lysozyme [Muribaculaceae bacterium]
MAYSWKDNVRSIFAILKAGLDNNEIATAGIIGNYRVECPPLYGWQKQGDVGDPDFAKSMQYTANINSGKISKDTFVHDSIGYGLAQWTYYTLKDDLYEYWKYSKVTSIGDTDMQARFQLASLANNYPALLKNLKAADGLREATELFLYGYENPADPDATKELRYQYAVAVLDYCTGTTPDPDPPTPVDPDPPDRPSPSFGSGGKWIYYMKPYQLY